MKKLLLSATACFLVAASIKAQQIQPCGTYQAREYYLKNVPGYAAQLNAAEAASRAEYQAFLQGNNAAKTSSLSASYTFTIPVVFHILHLGEAPGVGSNINDALCINALAQVNRDYAREGSDTSSIDPLFKPLYVNSNMHFMLAQKDPQGNCTNGIIHHYDPKTVWDQNDLFNYQYSTYGTGNWNPSKYLNIYIVKNIISSGSVVGGGIIVGYTHLPGTAPVSASDVIVYRNDFLAGIGARSLSHEIGHWFGLSHTFGSTNDPGFECGNDDIGDTPPTTGFFSTCPKPGFNYTLTPTVTTPVDSSDIVRVRFGKMDNQTALNSLTGAMIRPLITLVATTVTPTSDTSIVNATGVAGGYSNFTMVYGNDFNANTSNTISITSMAKSTDNNYVRVYIDYNNDGSYNNITESVFNPTVVVNNYSVTPIANAFGPRTFGTPLKINKTYTVATGPGTIVTTFTTTPDSFVIAPTAYTIPSGRYGLFRMRVITSNSPITSATITPGSGEFEEYNLNIGTTPSPLTGTNLTMATCAPVRPNIENIMDYSSCPKMFTSGQTGKMRLSAQSTTGNRNMLVDTANLKFTGILDANGNPVTVSPCAPTADFASNKVMNCAGQGVNFVSTSYNSTPTSYSWEFEGGIPSTSTLAAQSVTYSTPGTYSVSLTVTNAFGSSTKTVNSYVTTNWNASISSLPYNEDFESGQWWPAGWASVNPDLGTTGWELTNNYGAGVPASKGLLLGNGNNTSNFPGDNLKIDIMETPSFDFSNTTNLSLSFDYSFARKTGVTLDELRLQYSLDCGGTWSNVLPSIPTTAILASSTGSIVNAPYVPWSSATAVTDPAYKWKTVTISGTVFNNDVANERDVKFRFWFKNDVNGMSQNLYIDNFNISGVVGVREFENSLGLSIYPNPTNAASTVEFTSPTNSKVNVLVYDVTGRMVEQSDLNASAGVANKYSVNTSGKLTAGIYFISITIGNEKVVKKLIVN